MKFYEKIIIALDEEKISDNNERQTIILENLIANREKYIEYFNALDLPLNNWIFSNATTNYKHHRMDLIKHFVSFSESNKSMRIDDYVLTKNFNELFLIVTCGKKVKFQKELERFLLSNLIVEHESKKYDNMNFAHVELFEKVRTIFSLDGSENLKSLKEFNRYLDRLNKISLKHELVFITTELTMRDSIVKLCSMFETKPIDVLNKLNIPYHLIDKKIDVLNKYYETISEKLDISKEKKLYYFFNNLSKRVLKSGENFTLDNSNSGFSEKRINLNEEIFHIKTIIDFKELFDLGLELNNCSGNYETIDNYKNKYNYVVTDLESGKKFIGYIENGIFLQFNGYKNESPKFSLFKEVFDYLNKEGYVKDIGEHKNKKENLNYESLYEKECVHKIYIN